MVVIVTIVYGGGGITPDIYIPFKSNVNGETGKVLRDPKRPFFNFASEYANENRNDFHSFDNFRDNWTVPDELFNVNVPSIVALFSAVILLSNVVSPSIVNPPTTLISRSTYKSLSI